ncbi:isocitrate lyase/phosphoenolpyruvate mutase family protein [Sphingomonas oligophenolica]|uniref:Isocitrate lyase/phosphoenolpyruvate mutase family protein n=1 Tax=Sphingomonas oligophenolica TaxID=301154 RepID=A0A502BTZ4_9SPHN|nr:isocitrate lyase/phosphoenolpyruvate mutase family protein [Sphingomonas oligophenolica]
MPLAFVIANLSRIDRVSSLPLTVDLEGGYGGTLGELEAAFGHLLTTCAAGCNLEDGMPAGGIRSIEDQAGRIGAARKVVDAAAPGFFINARTDMFLRSPSERHADEELVSQAIERARAYQQACADGYFVPGLTDLLVLRTLAQAVELPINVMAGDEAIVGYIQAGVARISFGPLMYLKANDAVSSFAAERL